MAEPRPFSTPTNYDTNNHTIIQAATWKHDEDDIRIANDAQSSYPWGIKWKVGNTELLITEMTIKNLTRAISYAKMKPPNCEAAWEARLFQTLPWNKIWRIKSFFTSARDALTWLKLMHRNLYVANRDPSIQNKQCKAINCPHDESMMHLAQCTEIRRYFWDRIIDLMKRLNVRCVLIP